jgi:Heterokaryon incompatibility protein (HET)
MLSDCELSGLTSQPDDPAASHLPVLPVRVPVYSPEITHNIKDRLKICQEQHHECNLTSQEVPILPHRVIDVGAEDSSTSARLFINDSLQRGEYTCLSYCWGGPQDVSTTTATLEQYSICLPSDKLPQTIRDAINITRSLAIRYLWVDALCILQDNTDDKSVEIGEMGRIYRNAMVTIAAGSSQRVTDGFLKERTIPYSYQLPFYLSAGRFGIISLRACEKLGHAKVDPLETRGWTLQESLLSRRVLYYGSRDLLWKCQREHFVPVYKTHHFYFSTLGYQLPASMSSGRKGHHSEIPRLQSRIWRELVDNYSSRELTILEDRLPALAGIASELQNIWKDTYLAGMWQNCLIRQLGWQRTYIKDPPPEPFRSPSWSWASSRSRVIFLEAFREDARFVACEVIPVDKKSPLGRVKSAKLTLWAAIKPIPISLDARAFWMDLGPGGRCSVDQDSRLLFLGHRSKGYGICLIISPVGDGTYLRIGVTTMSGPEMDLWRAPNLERETVTLI